MVIEAGQTLALRFKEKGQYLRSFVADDSLFIDIMMNVGIIFYAAQQTGDDEPAAHRQPALPDDPPLPGARRRQHRRTRASSTRNRRVPAPEHPPGLARRFVLGARAGLGAVWLRHGLRASPAMPRFLHTAEACARLLHRAHARPRRAAERLGRAEPALPYESSAAAIAASGLLTWPS